MIDVKDAATAAARFVAGAQAHGQDYVNGTKGKGTKWQTNTSQADATWSAGVQAAMSAGRFKTGVNQAGPSAYETGVSVKGSVRYGPGVQAAGPKWQAKTSPFLDVIASLNLPPRGVRNSPQNWQRPQIIGDALHKKKMGG